MINIYQPNIIKQCWFLAEKNTSRHIGHRPARASSGLPLRTVALSVANMYSAEDGSDLSSAVFVYNFKLRTARKAALFEEKPCEHLDGYSNKKETLWDKMGRSIRLWRHTFLRIVKRHQVDIFMHCNMHQEVSNSIWTSKLSVWTWSPASGNDRNWIFNAYSAFI